MLVQESAQGTVGMSSRGFLGAGPGAGHSGKRLRTGAVAKTAAFSGGLWPARVLMALAQLVFGP